MLDPANGVMFRNAEIAISLLESAILESPMPEAK
jgi:hypothetical protein